MPDVTCTACSHKFPMHPSRYEELAARRVPILCRFCRGGPKTITCTGRVLQFFEKLGYGFIEAGDGSKFYFRPPTDAVFTVGDRVQFETPENAASEDGKKPKAYRVELLETDPPS